jgi:hypothetical protein
MKYVLVLSVVMVARMFYRQARRRAGLAPAPADPGYRFHFGVPRCHQCGQVVHLARRSCRACGNRLRLHLPIDQVLLSVLLVILALTLLSALRNTGWRF